MSLEELVYIIRDKELNIQVDIFPTLQELRHAVKLYLVSERDALAYINSHKERYKEERELMELNPELISKSTTYLDLNAIKDAKKVKVQKPDKNFHKTKIQQLDTDEPDTDLNGNNIDDLSDI
jgi:hypothetical protein